MAVATERHADAWPRYAGDLAGTWLAGDDDGATGFRAAQLRYANGMKLEVLEPWRVEVNDFLRRFLDRNGPGPHHLTYKVPDIRAALAAAEESGYTPVGVSLDHPSWKEAFLHPKQARGIVVQLAQSDGDWSSPPPDDLTPPRAEPANLDHVTHAVASLDDGLALFAGLLGGAETGRGDGPDAEWVELAWPGPGRVRLVAGGGVAAWLGDAPGRLHHLAFTCDDPTAVDGARPVGEGLWEVDPAANLGVRLRLRAR